LYLQFFFEPDYLNLLTQKWRETESLLKDRLLRLSIELDGDRYAYDPVKEELQIQFTLTDKPSDAFIQAFNFKLGMLKGDVFDFQFNEEEDHYVLLISGLLPEKNQVVFHVIPDLGQNLESTDFWEDVESVIRSEPVDIRVEPIKIYLEETLIQTNDLAISDTFTPFLKQFLSYCSFQMVSTKADAFYILSPTIRAEKKGRSRDNLVTEVSATVEIVQTLENISGQYYFSATRGYGKSWNAAVSNGLKGMMNRIDKSLGEMVSDMRSIHLPVSEAKE
jgi:hypothetical protein